MKEKLLNIKETISGYPVRDLRFLPLDNIIVGIVENSPYGKPELRNGEIAVAWKSNGYSTNKYKGLENLRLKM